MMKIGNAITLPSVYWVHLTNKPMTIVTTPTQIVGTNTNHKASNSNKTHYYPTCSIFFYLQNHLHVLTRFDANYGIMLSVILTHSHS
jgi:hypothetical protein